MQNQYKMELVLGDWSKDGHNQHDIVILSSNKPVEEVRDAYKKARELTSISFDERTYNLYSFYTICTEYEDNRINYLCWEILQNHGLTLELLNSFGSDRFDDEEELEIWDVAGTFVNFWIWFTKLGDKELELEISKEKIPSINGGGTEITSGFGYGLYS